MVACQVSDINCDSTSVTVTMIKHAVEMLQVYALAGVQFED